MLNDMRHSMRQNLNRKGFTMLELMIALIVFSIIGIGLTTVFVSGIRFYSEEQSQIENQQSLTQFSITLENDVRKSKQATKSINCLNLTHNDNTIVAYCYNSLNKTITRNSVVVAEGIHTFTLTVITNQIKLTVITSPDQRLTQNTLNYEYYLRTGNFE